MEKSTIFGILIFVIIVSAGFFFLRGSSATSNIVPEGSKVVQGELQEVVIGEKNSNYYPNTINVKAGKPVSITLDNSVVGCLRSFTIKDLGVSKYAKTPSETIDFTPTKKGTYAFACIMGMGYGKIIVE